jgi:hypothetical protein
MIRYLKGFGIGIVVMLAMSAVLASAAQATQPAIFTTAGIPSSNVYSSQLGPQVFTISGREVTCETATMTGTIANGSEEFEATPTYTNCHAVVLGSKLPATVTMNGCTYKVKATADVIGGQDTFTGITSIICPANKTVEIHIYSNATNHTTNTSLCTYTYYGSSDSKNQNLKHIDFTNEPAGSTPKDWLLAHITISNLSSTSHGSQLFCGPSESTTSSMHGTLEIYGQLPDGTVVGLTIETKP